MQAMRSIYLCDMAHDEIYICIICEETTPVTICAHKVRLLSIDHEYSLTSCNLGITCN